MKKIATLVTYIVVLIGYSQAQPVITASNYPSAGETYHAVLQFTTPSVGSQGPNATWDFSSLAPPTSPGPLSYQTPSSTTYGSSFPSANIALNFSIATLYYNSTSTKVDVSGSVSGNVALPYKNPQTAITFPFTYLDDLKDTARTDSIVTAAGKRRIRTTYSHTLADGYGSLILPTTTGTKTYTNVTRLRITAITTDSNFTNGSFASRDVYKDTSYYWFAEDFKPHLLWIEKDSSSSIISFYQYFNDPASLTAITNPILGTTKVYPNPAHSEVSVEVDQTESSGSSDLTFCLVSKLGEFTLIKNMDSPSKKFSLAGHKPGSYVYILKKGNDIVDKGKLTIE